MRASIHAGELEIAVSAARGASEELVCDSLAYHLRRVIRPLGEIVVRTDTQVSRNDVEGTKRHADGTLYFNYPFGRGRLTADGLAKITVLPKARALDAALVFVMTEMTKLRGARVAQARGILMGDSVHVVLGRGANRLCQQATDLGMPILQSAALMFYSVAASWEVTELPSALLARPVRAGVVAAWWHVEETDGAELSIAPCHPSETAGALLQLALGLHQTKSDKEALLDAVVSVAAQGATGRLDLPTAAVPTIDLAASAEALLLRRQLAPDPSPRLAFGQTSGGIDLGGFPETFKAKGSRRRTPKPAG